MPEIPIRSVAVSVVLIRAAPGGHEVLLLRRTRTLTGEWCQVAGAIEPNETAWQAALREVREETGLVPLALYSADICEQFYEADRDAISLLPVFVGLVAEDAEVVLNAEHSEHRWLSVEEAVALGPFSGQRHLLRHVHAEFVVRAPHPLLRVWEAPGAGES
jgi:dATP pyrophosphohydrolase